MTETEKEHSPTQPTPGSGDAPESGAEGMAPGATENRSSAGGEGGTGRAASTDLEAQLAAVRQEATAAQDRYLRTMADLENFRRRMVREKEELRAFAASRVVEELLPVLDNLALGLNAAKAPNADLKTLVGGIEMVATQFKNALSNHGLQEVNPLNQPFDPNQHEAIAQQPSPEVPDGHVLNVVRIGYSLNGRLLRPASVVVSSGAPAGAS
jgi:molecular chaperone GrpE